MVELDKSGIYKIVNIVNNKIYIGSATNIDLRWQKHKTAAIRQKHHSISFQRAWNKYGGEENFKLEILEYVSDKSKLLEREQFYLNLYQPFQNNGYNICKSGKSQLGLKRSDEAKRNMMLGQLGLVRSFEHRAAISIGNSKPEKWPCADKSKCKCAKCRKIKREYVAAIRKREAEKEGRLILGRMRINDA